MLLTMILAILILWFGSHLLKEKYWQRIKKQFSAEYDYFQSMEKKWIECGHLNELVLIKGKDRLAFAKNIFDLQNKVENRRIEKPFIIYQIKKRRWGRPIGKICTGTGYKL